MRKSGGNKLLEEESHFSVEEIQPLSLFHSVLPDKML